MSKQLFPTKSFALFIAFGLLLVAGCEEIPTGPEFYEYKAPPAKLRQIEQFDWEQLKAPPEQTPDVNEPPPGKLQLTLEECQEAKFEAAFTTTASYSKTDTPTETTLAGSSVDVSNIDLGVQVPLRTGGTVTFDLIDTRVKTDDVFSQFSESLNPRYTTDFSVSISQTLLQNAGNRANTHSIRIAQYDRQISEAQTKLEVIRVIAAADRAYWRLYAARKDLSVRKQQYDLANAQLEQARRFVDSGERAQVEVIRAEAGVAAQLEAIIVAENSVRDRERELKQILNKPGLKTQSSTVLIPATEADPVHYELAGDRVVTAAIENRMEMLELELQLAKDASTVDYLRNQALPLVTLNYTYNINGLGATRPDAYDLLFDKKFEDHVLGLQLHVPLGNVAAKSRLRQAFYQRRQRLATRQSRITLIEVEVLKAVDQLEANWQRILASRQNAILSGRLFQAEKRQFELGLRTSTDVLDAQTKFAQAQSAEILALTEYQIAQVDLAFATGILLGAAKVQWEPIVPTTD
jgi:outer membrane protein TolC